MAIDRRSCIGLLATTALAPALAQPARTRTIALLFDSLISPFWIAGIERFRARIAARGWSALEAVSNMDDDRQFQQVRSMIQRGVDGIVIVHTDDKAVIPAIRAANAAGIPIVHFNRPPAPSDAYSVAVVADNRKLMDDTVSELIRIARRQRGSYKAAVLLGDLGGGNAVQRRDGFNDAVARNSDIVEVVASIATEWNADKAFAGLSNALQAHPDINMLVTSSDFLTPQIEQALRVAGKWHKSGEPGHVLIAGFDGDDSGYAQLAAGYFDVDGVQDLDKEVDLTFEAFDKLWAGERPPKVLVDPGFVITRATLDEKRERMWGYGAWKGKVATANGAPVAQRKSGVATANVDTAVSPTAATGGARAAKWAVFTAALLAFTHALFTPQTFHDVLIAMLPLAILVAGQMLVLVIGRIDLSMTAVMALGSVLAAAAMTGDATGGSGMGATVGGVLVCLAVGGAIGLFNGLSSALLRIPSFVVTLAVMMAGSGAAVWYASTVSDTVSIGGIPAAFRHLGYGKLAGVPIALILSAAALAAIHYILSRTVAGRWLYAVGHNETAARMSGVPVHKVTIAAFTASGLCAGLAAVIYTGRIETGLPTLGQNLLLDIVGAAVIGGVSLFGGRGNVWMVLAGAAFLCLLDKSLQLLGLSLFVVLAVKGCAILLAAVVDSMRRRTREAR